MSRRLVRAGAVLVAVVLLGALVLSTPRVQRWAIRTIVETATAELTVEGQAPPRFSLESVGLHWSPLGIELRGARLSASDPTGADVEWASADFIVVRSTDMSGENLDVCGIEGLVVTEAGSHGLRLLLESGERDARTSESTAASFQLDRLYLSDCSFALPPAWIPDGRNHRLAVRYGEVRGITTGDTALPAPFDTLTLDLRLLSSAEDGVRMDTTFLTVAGTASSLNGDIRIAPSSWMQDTPASDALLGILPSSLAFDIDPMAGRCTLSSMMDWGEWTCGFHVDSGSIRLDEGDVFYTTIPDALPPSIPAPGRIALRGPVAWVFEDDASTESPSGHVEGMVDFLWEDAGSGGKRWQTSVSWNPGTQALRTEGSLDASVVGLTGFPSLEWQLSGEAGPSSVALQGPWSVSKPGVGTGAGRTEGSIALNADGDGAEWSMKWALDSRSAPLCITEGLEYYGAWSSEGECRLDSEGLPTSWWAHLDLTEGRFIPLPGFDGRRTQGPPLSMRRFQLNSRGDAQRFSLDLAGDFAEGHIEGPLDASAWWNPILDGLTDATVLSVPEADAWRMAQLKPHLNFPEWKVELTIWRDDLLERISHDQWSIGSGSNIRVSQRSGVVDAKLDLSGLHAWDWRLHDVSVSGRMGTSPPQVAIDAGGIRHVRWAAVEDATVTAAVDGDGATLLAAQWQGRVSGHFGLRHRLDLDGHHTVRPDSLLVRVADSEWRLVDPDSTAAITWSANGGSFPEVHDLMLSGDEGSVTLSEADRGILPGADIEIRLDHLDTKDLSMLVEQWTGAPMPAISGSLNGTANMGLAPFQTVGELQWDDATLEAIALGDLCMAARWSDKPFITLQQFRGEEEILTAHMKGQDAARVDFRNWPLEMLQPLMDRGIATFTGKAHGGLDVVLDDQRGVPIIEGALEVDIPALGVAAIGTEYGLSGKLLFADGFMGMDQARVTDAYGSEAILNLSVLHDGFADWNYDLGLDFPFPMQVMNLASDPGRLFHGEVSVEGDVNLFGTEDYMEVEARAETAPGTRFTMPLDALEGPDMPAGVRFTGGGPFEEPATAPKPAFDISLNLDLTITPEAELSMIFDQEANERVDGRARGNLNIIRSPSVALGMQGGLEIEEGNYRFSLRDLLTRDIAIAKGGRIDWDGDPYEAQLDLLAIAPFLTSPAFLLPNQVDPANTEVEVGMNISGQLSSPQLDFSIGFPSYERSDPITLSNLQSALSTREERERQSFALLATGQFIPTDQRNADLIQRTAMAQASELVSSGVSELLSSLSDDVRIGVRYVPSSDASNVVSSEIGSSPERLDDAFEMDLGLNLLNNRLRISGTLGAMGMDANSAQQPDLTGAVDVRYRLTADGRWELIGFSRPESALDGLQKHGVGAVYQVRFDRLKDLFRSRLP